MPRITFAICILLAVSLLAPTAGAADTPLYPQLVDQYLTADWDALESNLTQHAQEIAALSPDQAADIAYVKQTLAECHPAWWAQTKAGKKVIIHPTLWARPLNVIYDPSINNNLQLQSVNGNLVLSANWPAADMENPAPAEHGFSKGDLASLGDWAILGDAEVWIQYTPDRISNLAGASRTLFQRYQDFRGTVTGIYYGTPRARAWGCFLSLDAFGDHYANAPAFIARKPVGAMLVAEIVQNPRRYPTLRPTTRIPDEKVEQRVAASLMNQFARRITLAEDKALREAIKALAVANNTSFTGGARVVLPNKLAIMVDPAQDAAWAKKREAWLREQLQPPTAPPAPTSAPASAPSGSWLNK